MSLIDDSSISVNTIGWQTPLSPRPGFLPSGALKRDRSAAWRSRAFRSLPLLGDGHLAALQFGGFSLGDRASGDENLRTQPETRRLEASARTGFPRPVQSPSSPQGQRVCHMPADGYPRASRSCDYKPQQRAPVSHRMQACLQTCPSWRGTMKNIILPR
jgi:hypothetical protein